MNGVVRRLMRKDLDLLRPALLGYLAVGGVALALMAAGRESSFYFGTILLVTVVIASGMHIALATVVIERSEQTLPFVMTLPISPRQYTWSKIAGGLLIFLGLWGPLAASALLLLGSGWLGGAGRGLLPLAALTLVELLGAYAVQLAVAVVTESMPWTVIVQVLMNLGFQGYLYYVSRIPAIASTSKGPHIVWPPVALALLALELAVVPLALGLAALLQERRRDFL
jgi:hypothetical protein